MEGNIAATYTLIYRFLKKQSQHKAADAVKKAAKPYVILRDDVEHRGPPLEVLVREWKAKENVTKPGTVGSSSDDSDSSDDTSSDSEDTSDSASSPEDASSPESESDDTSDSDSDDSSDDSDERMMPKKLPQKAAERDTSATLSSAGDNAQAAAKQITQIPKRTSTKDKSRGSDSDGSNSDRSSGNFDAESSNSSSSDSDEDEASVSEKAPQNTTRTTEGKNSTSSESSSESDSDSDSESEDAHVAKKRRISEPRVPVAIAVPTGSQQTTRAPQQKETLPPKVKERFQRVKVQNIAPELLLNNGYQARGGTGNDYGERAHRDLIVTRGAGFRKEKNKKKRGSYRGGEITMENYSIKFDF